MAHLEQVALALALVMSRQAMQLGMARLAQAENNTTAVFNKRLNQFNRKGKGCESNGLSFSHLSA